VHALDGGRVDRDDLRQQEPPDPPVHGGVG
jgi:hypothetical protein